MRIAAIAATLFVVAILITPVPGDAQIVLRPGLYEMDIDFGIPAAGADAVLDAAGIKKEGDKRRECVTAEDLKDSGDLFKLMMAEMEDENCKVSGVKQSSNSMSFVTTCVDDGERMTWNIDMKFGPDWFTSVSNGRSSDGMVFAGKVNAKRVGDCKK
jgi:hypothetical protein